MTFRPGPLRVAAALAVGFIAVRVVYRVLFHGAEGAGAVVLPFPALRMPPPLTHVELLGPATVDGLVDAALSAVPIAAVILAFGVLNAALDLPRILARGARSGPFRGVARALALAWATLPALADAVRAVRFAQRLRGERPGIRLLSPVLERTLERATALAAALELRGYGGRGLAASGDEPPVVLEGATLGFASTEGGAAVVRAERLRLRPGELVVLAGATGSGKSTVLRALSGLHTHLDGGTFTGDLRVCGHDRLLTPPRDTARAVGVVLQHPREAFVAERVREEIGMSLELRAVGPAPRAERVHDVASRVGVAHLLDRPTRELSAGEATLVALAAAIVERPALLLVDEPLADLDAAARPRVVALLRTLARETGVCVLVAEHRTEAFREAADRWLQITENSLVEVGLERLPSPELATASATPAASEATPHPGTQTSGPPVKIVLSADAVTVRHGDRVAVDAVDVRLAAGERVALRGPNGAGKSSLLVALATGSGGAPAPRGRVVLVPDASDDLFVRTTVAAECRRVDRRARLAAGTTAERFAALLGREGDAADIASRHPRDLSAGERRCLAIALLTAHRPDVLLVDEPTRGLDPRARDLVRRAMDAVAAAGTAVLFATHDDDFAGSLADRVLVMSAGRIAPSPKDGASTASRAATAALTGQRAEPAAHVAQPPAALVESTSGLEGAANSRHLGTTRPPLPWRAAALVVAQVAALAAFLWPLAAAAAPAHAQSAVPVIALAVAPLAALVIFGALDTSVRSAHTLALLGVLAAVGTAVRIASTGVGGVEALFVLLILAGRAFGARFGLLLGAATIVLSAVVWGGVGPWLPFQLFACGWVAAGAGLLPRGVRGVGEIAMLSAYGILSSYLFGLLMNMWFWPFAVGGETSISYVPGAPLGENLGRFVVYSLATSTATWDTLRAVTTVVGLLLVGRPVLAALRRAKPVAATRPGARATISELPSGVRG